MLLNFYQSTIMITWFILPLIFRSSKLELQRSYLDWVRPTMGSIILGEYHHILLFFMSHESSYFLWHQQFGNAPSHSLIPMSQKLSFICDHNICYDVCYRARRIHLPFPLSQSKANRAFDLPHCGVWGTYPKAVHTNAHYFLSIVNDYSQVT